MKLCIVLPSLNGGGAERVMINIAHEMMDRGHDVCLIAVNKQGALLSILHPELKVIDLQQGRLLKALPSLRSTLRSEKPDAVLSAMAATNCIVGLAHKVSGSHARLVMSERASPVTLSHRGRFNRHLLPALRRITYPWADVITTVSSEVADELMGLARLNRKRVVPVNNPGPVLCEKSDQSPHDWFEEDGPVLVSAGRLDGQKDQATMIRALAKLRNEVPAKLILLGEGKERESLEKLTSELDLEEFVFMPGFVENSDQYIRRADCVVMSSVSEGTPNVLIEALHLGRKCVATACPGGTIEVLGGGKFGWLSGVGDYDMLAQTIQTALTSEPKADLGTDRYDRAKVFDIYEDLLFGKNASSPNNI